MNTHSTSRTADSHPIRTGFAGGTTVAAAVLLMIAGVLSILQGIAALFSDELFIVGLEYTYSLDLTGWGWIHLIVGVLVVAAGTGVLMGATWARVAAITLAGLSIVANFLWLPYYPWWSILVIALDVLVIWAVATWRPAET